MKSFRSTLFAILAAIISLWVVHSAREFRRAARLRLSSANRDLQIAISEAEKLTANVPSSLSKAGPGDAQEAKDSQQPSTATPIDKAAGKAAPQKRDLLTLLQDDPALEQMYWAARKAQLASDWWAFCQAAGFNDEKRERFLAILSAQQERIADTLAAARAEGLAAHDPALDAVGKEIFANTRNELLQLLGDKGFDDFRQFRDSIPARDEVSSFAASVTGLAPLSGNQGEQLNHVMTEAYAQADKNKVAIDYANIADRASAILTASQLKVFRARMEMLDASQQLARFANQNKSPLP